MKTPEQWEETAQGLSTGAGKFCTLSGAAKDGA